MTSSLSRSAAVAAALLATAACVEAPSDPKLPPSSASSGGASTSSGGASSGGASSGGTSSGGGSSSGATSSGGSSGGASSGGGSSGGGYACVGTSSKAMPQPLDLYVMLDRSASMNDLTTPPTRKWGAVTGALLSFVQQPGLDGTSVGLQYFPPDGTGDACAASTYATADVEIEPIAQAASQLAASIAKHAPGGLTPTFAALQGATQHAAAWGADPAHAKHAVAVVLATDGAPTMCDTNLDHIDAIASAARSATPSIRTFVIGVGDLKSNLDGIAQAGGTGSAFIVQTTGDVTTQFLEALNQIRGNLVGCTYQIPAPPDGQNLDYGQVGVRFLPSGGAAAATLAAAQDAAGCGTRDDAWHYDDAAKPQQIVLCPATCQRVQADKAGEVDVVLGCTSPIAR